MIEILPISSYYYNEMKYKIASMFNQSKKRRLPTFDQELLEAFK